MMVGLSGPDFSFAQEVGRGTIEINTRACVHLHEVDACYRAALARLLPALAEFGWRLLGYGIQPLSPASAGLLAPKARYLAMHQAMGDDWLWYGVTASDQTQVAIAQEEMLLQLNTLHRLTPAIVALCANSPICGGSLSPFCSAREGVAVRGTFGDRHGIPPGPYATLPEFVTQLSDYPLLLRRQGGALVPGQGSLGEMLAGLGEEDAAAALDAFLLHEHYIWHSARLRHAYGTIEVRPACQQPPAESMAACALILGMVCSAQEQARLLDEALGPDSWAILRAYHSQGIAQGLAAAEPVPGLLGQILGLAEQALIRRGHGEEIYLAPLGQRLARGENPAQRLRAIYQAEGMRGLLSATQMEIPEKPHHF
jgi:gamma-glutamylcysteine synthetase